MSCHPHARHLALALLGLWAVVGHALDVPWDGKRYIPIGLQEHADTVVIFPEPVEPVWAEEPSLVQKVRINPSTFVLSPKVAHPEQRLFAIGKRTNTIYVGRLSAEVAYHPTVNITQSALVTADRALASGPPPGAASDAIALARSMMRDEPPPGFARADSHAVLLDAHYRLQAREIWSSPQTTGIVAELSRGPGRTTVELIPRNLVLRIPQLGSLRFVGADRFELSPDHPTTRVYLIFER